jgi:hypothetical protein
MQQDANNKNNWCSNFCRLPSLLTMLVLPPTKRRGISHITFCEIKIAHVESPFKAHCLTVSSKYILNTISYKLQLLIFLDLLCLLSLQLLLLFLCRNLIRTTGCSIRCRGCLFYSLILEKLYISYVKSLNQ